jgi:hypothetical protein
MVASFTQTKVLLCLCLQHYSGTLETYQQYGVLDVYCLSATDYDVLISSKALVPLQSGYYMAAASTQDVSTCLHA